MKKKNMNWIFNWKRFSKRTKWFLQNRQDLAKQIAFLELQADECLDKSHVHKSGHHHHHVDKLYLLAIPNKEKTKRVSEVSWKFRLKRIYMVSSFWSMRMNFFHLMDSVHCLNIIWNIHMYLMQEVKNIESNMFQVNPVLDFLVVIPIGEVIFVFFVLMVLTFLKRSYLASYGITLWFIWFWLV